MNHSMFSEKRLLFRSGGGEKPHLSAEKAKNLRESVDSLDSILKKIPKAKSKKPDTLKSLKKLLKRMKIDVHNPATQKLFTEEDRHVLLRSLAARYSKDKNLLSNLAGSPNHFFALVNNNYLPESILAQMAMNIDSYKLTTAFGDRINRILVHHNCTPILRRAIFKKYKDKILLNVNILYFLITRKYGKTPPDVLNEVAYSKLPAAINYYQLAEFNNSKILHYLSGLTTKDLKHLKGDKAKIVAKLRIKIAKNKNVSNATVELLCSDGNIDVQVAAVSNFKVRERYLREILNNPDAPQEVKKAIKKALIKRGLESLSTRTA